MTLPRKRGTTRDGHSPTIVRPVDKTVQVIRICFPSYFALSFLDGRMLGELRLFVLWGRDTLGIVVFSIEDLLTVELRGLVI